MFKASTFGFDVVCVSLQIACMTLFLFGISMGEVVLIFLVILMLFGSKNLPELARGLGKGLNSFRRAADEIKQELSEGIREVKHEAEETFSEDDAPLESIDDASVADVYGLDRAEEEEKEDGKEDGDRDLSSPGNTN